MHWLPKVTASSLTDLYDKAGYYPAGSAAKTAGTHPGYLIDASGLTGTLDRGTGDALAVEDGTCIQGPEDRSLTIQGSWTSQGTGSRAINGHMHNVNWDSKGYGNLNTSLTGGTSAAFGCYRSTVVLSNVDISDSVGHTTNLFRFSAENSDSAVLFIGKNVTMDGGNNGDDVCSFGVDEQIERSDPAFGTKFIRQNCRSRNPGSASNNQADTSHRGFDGYDINQRSEWHGSSNGQAINVVNNTRYYTVNPTIVGPAYGLTGWWGGTCDLDGTTAGVAGGGILFNGDCDSDTWHEGATVFNWNTSNINYAPYKYNDTGENNKHTLYKQAFANTNGTIVDINSTTGGRLVVHSCVTTKGSSGIDVVILDRGITGSLVVDLINNAMQCGTRSGHDNTSNIEYGTVVDNVFESNGSGVTFNTTFNAIGTAPTDDEIDLRKAGSTLSAESIDVIEAAYSGAIDELVEVDGDMAKVLDLCRGNGRYANAPKKVAVRAQTGLTLYALFVNADGRYWNGSTYETYDVSNWTDYASSSMSEDGSTGRYSVSKPVGSKEALIHVQSGGSPASSDLRFGVTPL